jgi:hypothetical protein
MGETRHSCRVLVRKPDGKRPLGRPSRAWEDIIMYLEENMMRTWNGFLWFMTRVGCKLF